MREEVLEILKYGAGFWVDRTDVGTVILGIEASELNEIELTKEEVQQLIRVLEGR